MKIFLCHVSAVGWSAAPSFSPLLGELVVEDTTLLQYNITGLTAVSSAALFLLVVRLLLSIVIQRKRIHLPPKSTKKMGNTALMRSS